MDLRKAANEAGVLGTQIAERFGITPATASRWLSGKIPVPSQHVIDLADMIRVDPVLILQVASERQVNGESR
jgi:hypothetical protein